MCGPVPSEAGRRRATLRESACGERALTTSGKAATNAAVLNPINAFNDQRFGQLVNGLCPLKGGLLHLQIRHVLAQHTLELRLRLIPLHVAQERADSIEQAGQMLDGAGGRREERLDFRGIDLLYLLF